MPSQFGQVADLLNLANQAQYLAAKTVIDTQKLKADGKLSQKELDHQGRLANKDLQFRYKELEAKMAVERRRDALFKDIALYAGVGALVIVILITLGVIFIGKKEADKYEYVMEVNDA